MELVWSGGKSVPERERARVHSMKEQETGQGGMSQEKSSRAGGSNRVGGRPRAGLQMQPTAKPRNAPWKQLSSLSHLRRTNCTHVGKAKDLHYRFHSYLFRENHTVLHRPFNPSAWVSSTGLVFISASGLYRFMSLCHREQQGAKLEF